MPKYTQGKRANGDRWSIFRWGRFGWDALARADGTRFIQFGSGPVKYVYWLAKGTEYPLFLIGKGWKTSFCKGRLRVGTTTKPLNMKSLWEVSYGKNRTSTTVRAGSQPARLYQQHGNGPDGHSGPKLLAQGAD